MKYKKASDLKLDKKLDYSKSIIFTPDDFKGGYLLQTVTIPANTKQRKHFHNLQTEVFYILAGTCSIFINDKVFKALPGDSFIVEPQDTHYLWNKADLEFKLVVFKFDKPGDDDTVWVE